MNELSLFSGAGGGILGGQLLGWRTVCAVELNPYCASLLVRRQTTAFSRLSRYGMTCEPLTADLGADLLTWYRAASLAKTFATQDHGKAWTAPIAGYGLSSPASFAKYDPASHSLKTAQGCLFADSTESCLTLPAWGSMQSGECYQRPNLAHPICAPASGLWPTPTATAYKGWAANHNRAETNDRIDYRVEREAANAGQTGRLTPEFCEWLMGFPTGWTESKPLAMDKFRAWQRQHSPTFARQGDTSAD